MKEWLTASDIADLGLEGLAKNRVSVWEYAKKHGWYEATHTDGEPLCRKKKGQGQGVEFHISLLPKRAQKDYARRQLTREIAPQTETRVSAPTSHPNNADDLTAFQRDVMNARAAFVATVNDHAALISRNQALDMVVELAKAGRLPAHLQDLLSIANAKSGRRNKTAKSAHKLSRRTLYQWVLDHEKGGILALAPNITRKPDYEVPDWAPALMQLWSDPRKPSLTAVLEDLPAILPRGTDIPSYDQARRFLHNKISIVDKNRGRMGPQALKSLQAFTRRDISELWPGAVYTADGHTFRAKVEHPFHGQPFQPEITFTLDVFTKYIIGWSVGLAENSIGVLEALSHAIVDRDDGRYSALPLIFYTDNGRGFKNEMFSSTAIGFFDRWGITQKNSLPYNSQARGIIERFNRNVRQWAKKLTSYSGSELDKEAKRHIDRARIQAAKKAQKTPFDTTWEDFKSFIQEQIDTYNNRPQSSLKRVRDPETKAWRHQAPAEVWAEWLGEGGKTRTIAVSEAADLMRPYERRKVARCEIRILNNIYFSHALEAYHGQDVLVGYDIHDASRVWVRDFDMRLIAVAELDANARPYFDSDTLRTAQSKQDQVLAARTKGRLGRIEEKRQEIIAEAKGPALEIEYQPAIPMEDFQIKAADDMLARLEQPKPVLTQANGRPDFF
ncbi:Mu transposase C-terminal domain-containing protein [Thalassospira sp. MCCC 1A01428]|uniref:Mu transposase C-terminal domain-containing protein n=1 Tax=Thalassospira sp. MCCC 1A01428 TaxID=1470575 RepID=UPI00143DFB27|nr:Mu transposase C-terminal domain-containing protein [Thalassospira sp. MCCC 1A01428]